MGFKRLTTLLLTGMLLLFSSVSVHAATDTNILWDIYNKVTGYVLGFLKDFVKAAFELFWGALGAIFATALNELIKPFKALILWNPDVGALSGFVGALTKLLVPVYVFLIVLTGVYFIFVSISPSERAHAKSMLQKLVLGMVLVSLAMPIYKVLLAVSGALAERLLSGVSFESSALLGFVNVYLKGPGSAATALAVGALSGFTPVAIFFVTISLYLLLVVLAALVVAMRDFVVYLMAALFPLTLFFYFFDYTKGIGQKMWQYTIMAIFTQVIQAFVLAVAIIAVNSAGTTTNWVDSYIMLLVGEGAFFMIIIAPLIMMDILPWIGGALAMVGSVLAFVPGYNVVGGAMVAAGGVMGGMGAGSLMAGGTMAGLGGAHSQSVINAMAGQQQQGGGGHGAGGGGGGHGAGGGGGGYGGGHGKPPAPTGFYATKAQPFFNTVGKTAVGTAVMPPVGLAYGAYKGVRKGASLAANTKTGQRVAGWASKTRVGQTLAKAKEIYRDRQEEHELGGIEKVPKDQRTTMTGKYRSVIPKDERERLKAEAKAKYNEETQAKIVEEEETGHVRSAEDDEGGHH